MTKYLHDVMEPSPLWTHQEEILDHDLERLEYEKSSSSDVYNSILDDEPVYHSLMNFPEDEEEQLYDYVLDGYVDDGMFNDHYDYKHAHQDDACYFI